MRPPHGAPVGVGRAAGASADRALADSPGRVPRAPRGTTGLAKEILVTHFLLGLILGLLFYVFVWRPIWRPWLADWLAERRLLRDIHRQAWEHQWRAEQAARTEQIRLERLRPTGVAREARWIFPLLVLFAAGVIAVFVAS
jgi:hypothetical protein